MDFDDSYYNSGEEEEVEENHRYEEEEEDDDIIIVQDNNPHIRHSSAYEESQGSPSQYYEPETQRTPQQPPQYPRYRRQEPSSRPAGTAAVLAASQEEARRYFSGRDNNNNNNNNNSNDNTNLLLNQSNPFAGLEALLDQQQFTMSMTQEDENDVEEEENGNDNDKMQQQELPCQEKHADMAAELDASKENSRNYLPGANANKCVEPNSKKQKATKANDDVVDGSGNDAIDDVMQESLVQENHNNTDFPTKSGNDIGFTPMFEEESHPSKELHKQHNYPDDETANNGLDQELQKQRSRKASLSSSRPTKPSAEARNHAQTHNNNKNKSMQQDVQPSKALRQHLQSKKTSRSKSADKIAGRPSKRTAVRPRSTSPMARGSSSSSRSKSPVQVPVEKANRSLVGLRPSHWGRGGTAGSQKRSASPFSDCFGSGRSASAMLERQRKQLADACNSSSFLMAPNARRQGSRPGNRTRSASPVPIATSMSASMDGPVNASVDSGASALRQAHQTSNVFATGNPVRVDPMEIDTIEDNMSDDMEEANDSAQNVSFLATTRANNNMPKGSGRRKSSGQGNQNGDGSGLLQLLQKIRTEVRTDKTRLRSGEYPFPNKISSRFDLYDPRNRATSYVDVTIVGESWAQCHETGNSNQWSRQARPTNSNMVILGYIHTHHIYPERNKLPAVFSVQTGQCLAWINFSGETIQEHSLLNSPQGSQLRIYNPLVTPIVLDERVDTTRDKESTKICRYNVICTQLCEVYPTSILGNLEPGLSQILAAQA